MIHTQAAISGLIFSAHVTATVKGVCLLDVNKCPTHFKYGELSQVTRNLKWRISVEHFPTDWRGIYTATGEVREVHTWYYRKLRSNGTEAMFLCFYLMHTWSIDGLLFY